ncbi:hypothetical protein RHMOL_Rhmol03G0082500 [Rhododendron molle]|uniref:Uncharacterized protein n=1 Tax=Rhododendron molle TaxID=49168 RepID=A0ACC0PBH2_RHOML|nr:hypothetical protein RHMOL_Rhmol03G0082500 [Rhododendron molle]
MSCLPLALPTPEKRSSVKEGKLQSHAVREAISEVAEVKEKKHSFAETVELPIGLKNRDPQKDKRFSGSVMAPHIPHPKNRNFAETFELPIGLKYDPQKDKWFRLVAAHPSS